MSKNQDKRARGTIPVHELRGTAAMMHLTQAQISLAERAAEQTRRTMILTRWVVALCVLVAFLACVQIGLLLR